jgi:hypothetical protein
LYRQALYYYVCCLAKTKSFVEIYNDLEKWFKCPKRRWKAALRAKRGMYDSAQPGGLYKDMAYLRGAVQILQYRNYIDFSSLYCGKIALEDLLETNK